MAKPKLKAKTMEQALSALEAELAEVKAVLHRVRIQRDEELEERDALVVKLTARNDALVWALVLAQHACWMRETELRKKGDSLALAG